jgi:hypothetical protein
MVVLDSEEKLVFISLKEIERVKLLSESKAVYQMESMSPAFLHQVNLLDVSRMI